MLRESVAAVLITVVFITSASAQTAAPTSLTGCIQKAGETYTLTDEKSNVTAQLRGGNLRAGKHVQVTGSAAANATPAAGATQVLDVTAVKRISGNCQAPTGNTGNSFMSRGTAASIGVIAGVAAVAAWATISRLGEARGGK